MKLALITDIHANREALEACLEQAHLHGADKIAFLGDFVGYGGDPVSTARRPASWSRAPAARWSGPAAPCSRRTWNFWPRCR
jgi:hypothetical protein